MPVIKIPPGAEFSALHLTRLADGAVDFVRAPLESVAAASGISEEMLAESGEDGVCALLVAWYAAHLAAGGGRDPTMDDLIGEMIAEDALGGGLSHAPGRA